MTDLRLRSRLFRGLLLFARATFGRLAATLLPFLALLLARPGLLLLRLSLLLVGPGLFLL